MFERHRDTRPSSSPRGKAVVVLVVAVALLAVPVAFTGVGAGTQASAATFEVSDLETPEEMVGGDPVTVTATVTNTGDTEATKPIEFRFYPYEEYRKEYSVLASAEVQLAPGESTTVTLTSTVGEPSGGSYDVGVVSPDDGVTTTLDLLGAANFELSDLETQDVALNGGTANASVTVTNIGGVTATYPVKLTFQSGGGIAERNVTLAPGESKRIEITVSDISANLFGSGPSRSRTESFGFLVQGKFGQQRLEGALTLIPGERTIRIEGTGQYTTYEIRTTYGAAGKNRLESGDVVDGAAITGAVVGGVDAYTVTGNIPKIQVNGPDEAVTVYLDGGEISLNPYGDEDTVTFVGDGNASTYAFTASEVTGGDGLGPADSFTQRSGSGFVSSGSDAYTFEGVLKSVSLSPGSDIRVLVDGQEIDPYELGRSTTITFVGNGTTGTYGFTASNEIVDRRRLEAGTDDLDSFGRATGVVRGGIDEFVYTGELERLDVDPSVTVYIDGEEVDPDTVDDDS